MTRRRVRDDVGGVWITTGWVVGIIVYAGIVLSWHAGFTAATPFVVIPPVLLIMIGAGNWISGKRPGRPAPKFNRPDPVPLSSLRSPPEGLAGGDADEGPAAEGNGTGR